MFYPLSIYPADGDGSNGMSIYPVGHWKFQQVMSPTRVRFTPATGPMAGQGELWFEYYRALNDLLSAGGVARIGVRTAPVATFDGFNFDQHEALNPVIEHNFPGAPAPVAGGTLNDLRAFIYNGKIRLTIAIYNNPLGSNSNRTAIFESADGFTFAYVGEATKDGGYLGRTIGAIANVGGTLVALVSIANGAGGGNGRQKWISTDGGLTWVDRGLAIPVGAVNDWNGLTYIGGTMDLEGDYYVAYLSGMRFIGNNSGGTPYLDWGGSFGAFRCHVDDILSPNVMWEGNASNPMYLAGATFNALWHATMLKNRGTTYCRIETWGSPGLNLIGGVTSELLRTTPYYGTEARATSSQLFTLIEASTWWRRNWTTRFVADGAYTLRHIQSNKFVSLSGGVPVLTDTGVITEFTVAQQLSFYTLGATVGEDDLILQAPNNRLSADFSMVADPGPAANTYGQWHITPFDDAPEGQPKLVVITNRGSRLALALPRDTEQDGAPLTQMAYFGDAAMVFEIAPVERVGTEISIPDPGSPGMNIVLPAGDLVGTTEPQILENKTVINSLTRAQLIARAEAGAFNALPDGAVIFTQVGAFEKRAGAAYLRLPVGFVPNGEAVPEHFGAVGDGVANDTDAMVAWLAWVYFATTSSHGDAKGIYGITNNLGLPPTSDVASNQKLTNLHLVALDGFPANTFMVTVGGNGWTITGCTFDGNGFAGGINVEDYPRLIVTGNHFIDCVGYCIYSPSVAQDSIFSANHFRGPSGPPYEVVGIYAGSAAADLMITNNKFQWMQRAIHVIHGGVQILGNHLYQGQGGGDELLAMKDRPDGIGIYSKGKNVLIANNYIDKCCIMFELTSGMGIGTGAKVLGNLFYTRAVYAEDDAFIVFDGISGRFEHTMVALNHFQNEAGAASAPNLFPIRYATSAAPVDAATALIGMNIGEVTENDNPTLGAASFGGIVVRAVEAAIEVQATGEFDTAVALIEGSRTNTNASAVLRLADRNGGADRTVEAMRLFDLSLYGDVADGLGTLRLSASAPGSLDEVGLLRFTGTSMRPESIGEYDLGTTGFPFGNAFVKSATFRGPSPQVYQAPPSTFQNSETALVGNRTAGGDGVLHRQAFYNNITGADVLIATRDVLADGSVIYSVGGVEVNRMKANGETLVAAAAGTTVFQKLTADYVLTSTTALQKMFPTGAATVPRGLYEYVTNFYFTDLSAVSGNLGFTPLGAGSAVVAACQWWSIASDTSSGTGNATLSGRFGATSTAPASMATIGTGSTFQGQVRGTMEITTAGTIIPSVILQDAAAARVMAGSYFLMKRIGDSNLIGVWA